MYSAGTVGDNGEVFPNSKDFRNFVNIFWNGLRQLCSLAQQNVDRSIALFSASSMLVKEFIPRLQFHAGINATIDRFQQETPIEFTRTLNLLRTTIQGNALMAVFSTNWQLTATKTGQGRNSTFRSIPTIYSDRQQNTSCSCATLRNCTTSAQIFDRDNTVNYTIEGLRLGCYSLETILASSLSCFYSSTCIYKFRQRLRIPNDYLLFYQTSTNGTIEFDSTKTRFNINDRIEILANEMFIESWSRNVSYERFFNSCAPVYCTHREYYRFDALELLTTFLSVYVGLSFGARILAPLLVKMVKKIRNRFRVVPVQ